MPADVSTKVVNFVTPHLDKLQEFTEQTVALLSQGDFDQAAQLLTERQTYLTTHFTPEWIEEVSEKERSWISEELDKILAQDLQQQEKVVEMMSVINGKLGKIYKNKKNINSYLDVRNI